MTRQRLDGIDYELLETAPDEVLRSKISALWTLAGVTIPDPEQRLNEVRAVAWQGENLIAVSSCARTREPNTQQILWDIRGLVHPDFRSHKVISLLAYALMEQLEQGWHAGKDPAVIGIMLALEAAQFHEDHMPMSGSRQTPFNATSKFFFEVGQLASGTRIGVYYFPGSYFCYPGENTPRQPAPVSVSEASLPAEFVYQRIDTSLAELIIQFWLAEGALLDREHCLSRLPQVAAVCRDGDRIVAVASVFPGIVEQLGCQLYVLRVFVGQAYRQQHLALGLIAEIYAGLNEAFSAGQLEPRLPGMVMSIHHAGVSGRITNAYAPRVGFALAGFDSAGNQLRLRWFEAATLGDRKQAAKLLAD